MILTGLNNNNTNIFFSVFWILILQEHKINKLNKMNQHEKLPGLQILLADAALDTLCGPQYSPSFHLPKMCWRITPFASSMVP